MYIPYIDKSEYRLSEAVKINLFNKGSNVNILTEVNYHKIIQKKYKDYI